jgi:hypothetical protein
MQFLSNQFRYFLAVSTSFFLMNVSHGAELNLESDATKKWSIEWGWNNESYGRSDIHFKGTDHQFTLFGVSATDTQKTLTPQSLFNTYLNPGRITIPQTNARIAYQLSSDTAIALNLDHMKYVVSDGQTVAATGQYLKTNYGSNGQQYLSPSFMHYEQTDGLNVISIEYEKKYPLSVLLGSFNLKAFALVGAGVVIPKSNITMTMLGQARNDKFHLAGTNLDAAGGLELDFSKTYFARSTIKLGQVNLTDVVTSARQDKASQKINYQEVSLTFGARF